MYGETNVVVVDTHGKCSRASAESACAGEVTERLSRSGLTRSHICELHREQLEEQLDRIAERYPDTATPPSWFDPTYAGESWDGE